MASMRDWLSRLRRGPVGGPADPGTLPRHREVELRPARTMAEASNAFGLALYGLLREEAGNIFVSPFCINAALAMTLGGARGETAEEMRRVLCIGFPESELHEALSAMISRLNRAGGGKCEMSVASSLWGQAGERFLEAFLGLVERHYRGGMDRVDFRGATEAARATAVAMDLAGCPSTDTPLIPLFRADHPFLLAIRDKVSGVILFLGRVADPSREQGLDP